MVKDPAKRLGYMGADDILRHQWFGHLDLDALAMDQVESPYIPTKDINAAPQRAIGSFADAGSKVMTEYCIRTETILDRNASAVTHNSGWKTYANGTAKFQKKV